VLLTFMKSKLHRATVTEANIEYEGSIAIDPVLMRAADIHEYERVSVWNCTNGSRLETYAILGEEASGEICINGAAAHLCKPGDLVIIATWAQMTPDEAGAFAAKRVFLDGRNQIKDDVSSH
jgi:aspartate 1-decarboxylase